MIPSPPPSTPSKKRGISPPESHPHSPHTKLPKCASATPSPSAPPLEAVIEEAFISTNIPSLVTTLEALCFTLSQSLELSVSDIFAVNALAASCSLTIDIVRKHNPSSVRAGFKPQDHLQSALQSLPIPRRNEFMEHAMRTIGCNSQGRRLWLEFYDHEFFRQPKPRKAEHAVPEVDSQRATQRSWHQEYVGNASDALYVYASGRFKERNTYARFLPIVQSSAIGKSRALDELAKTYFTVPLCLRMDGSSGYPPPDITVRDFLQEGADEEDDYRKRVHAFLTALSIVVRSWLLERISTHSHLTIHGIAAEFRQFMTEGMTHGSHNAARVSFYRDVVTRADALLPNASVCNTAKTRLRSGQPEAAAGTSGENMVITEVEDAVREEQMSKEVLLPSPEITFEAPDVDEAITTKTMVKELIRTLLRYNHVNSPCTLWESQPLVLLAFDESHELTKNLHHATNITRFDLLREALRSIRELSVFSFFLSTTGKVFQFSGPAIEDSSLRVQTGVLQRIPAYTEFGLDHFAHRITRGKTTLEDVAKIAYMVSFGRAGWFTRFIHGSTAVRAGILEFAAEKLLGNTAWMDDSVTAGQALACLSVRLALEFRSPNPQMDTELHQIEHHMRVCIDVSPAFDSVKSISPSEPILAEAAAAVMMKFDPVTALADEFKRPGIARGPKGEYTIMLMILLIRDHLTFRNSETPLESIVRAFDVTEATDRTMGVVPFMENFFPHHYADVICNARPSCVHPRLHKTKRLNGNAGTAQPFAQMFENARCYVNHFVKVNNFESISRRYLFLLALRGASIICADNQRAIDIITPFLFWDTRLNEWNVSVILWQIQNDRKYSAKPDEKLFQAMDPYALGIFKREPDCDVDDRRFSPLPVIRIVCALAAGGGRACGLKNFTDFTIDDKIDPRVYTSYDFWAHGFSPDLYGGLAMSLSPGSSIGDPKPSLSWQILLDRSYDEGAYDQDHRKFDPPRLALRRTQAPGAYADEPYFTQWAPLEEEDWSIPAHDSDDEQHSAS